MSTESENKKDNSEEFDVDFSKFGELFKESAKDLKEFLKEEKVYKGESFFDLFEKNLKNFKNPLENIEKEFGENNSKIKETFSQFKEKFTSNNVKKTNLNSILIEEDNLYKIEVLVPGFNKSELDIELDENNIEIKSLEIPETDSPFKNPFEIKYNLEDDADLNNISSKLENGILTIIIPKIKTNKKETKKVEIN